MNEFTEDERAATLRLLAGEPDGDFLAAMLGLVEVVPEPVVVVKPKIVTKRKKLWCDIHHIAREPIPSDLSRTRCIMCFRENSRKRYYKETKRPVPDKVRVYNRKATDV